MCLYRCVRIAGKGLQSEFLVNRSTSENAPRNRLDREIDRSKDKSIDVQRELRILVVKDHHQHWKDCQSK